MLKILVAVDGSELSLDGVQHTLQLLKQGLQASVVLAHVQEPATLYELVTSRDPDLIAAASVEAGEHLLASARALLDAAGVVVGLSIRLWKDAKNVASRWAKLGVVIFPTRLNTQYCLLLPVLPA